MTEINQSVPNSGDERYIESDTALLELEVTKEDGSIKDLTGADIRFSLSNYAGSDSLISKDSSSNDINIIDEASGKVKIRINDGETEGLGDSDGEEYHYEIKVRDNTGDINTVTTGKWTIYATSEPF